MSGRLQPDDVAKAANKLSGLCVWQFFWLGPPQWCRFNRSLRESLLVDNVEWTWRDRVHPMTANAMLECITELATAAQCLPIATKQSNESAAALLLKTAVRQMSVPIRKLCLDGESSLLQKAIEDPQFLPLGGIKGEYSKATMKWKTQRHEWTLGYKGGRKEEVIVPETEHEIEVGRLYGIEFKEDGWYQIRSPFDETGHGIDMDTWLATKIFQVNSIGYTVRDALKLVADFEGAHANDQLPAFVAVGVKPDDFDKGAKKRYRMANCIYFGCLSYIQMIVIYSGLYIIRKIQSLIQSRSVCKEGIKIGDVAEIISAVRPDLSARSRIVNGCHEMIVVGKSNLSGADRKQTMYRIWSGCEEWDKPLAKS